MKEIDDLKKTDKHQKFQIKKLVNENDKLKKEYSRVSDMRRFTVNDKPVRNNVGTQMGDIDDLAHKYDRLKSRLVGITDSLLTALDDDDDFTVVSKGKHNGFTPTLRPSTSSQAPQMPSDSGAPRQRCPSVQLLNVAAPIPTRCLPGAVQSHRRRDSLLLRRCSLIPALRRSYPALNSHSVSLSLKSEQPPGLLMESVNTVDKPP